MLMKPLVDPGFQTQYTLVCQFVRKIPSVYYLYPVLDGCMRQFPSLCSESRTHKGRINAIPWQFQRIGLKIADSWTEDLLERARYDERLTLCPKLWLLEAPIDWLPFAFLLVFHLSYQA